MQARGGALLAISGDTPFCHDAFSQARKFRFPLLSDVHRTAIAAYGVPDLGTKTRVGAVKEHEWNVPTTMYGCNKLYGEHLGRYYARHYRQLAATTGEPHVDFRSLRFPGLISAFTLPTGGTSDYAPEMLHHAAQGKPYACFVREDTRIPFMAMPDAIDALTRLEAAPRERLTGYVYNVTSFSPTAGELRDRTLAAFPGARISFEPDLKRQAIVDTWPVDQDDTRARRDWGWQPAYDEQRAFDEYLVPNEPTAQVLRAHGVDPGAISVFGFPVQTVFSKGGGFPAPPDPAVEPRLLYVVNAGRGRAHEVVRRLMELRDLRITVSAGNSPRVEARIRGLASRLKARLAEVRGVRLRTPQSPGLSAGLVCFEVAGRDPSEVVARLASKRIVASVTPYATRYVRLGPGIVNTPEHVDAAVRAIRAL